MEGLGFGVGATSSMAVKVNPNYSLYTYNQTCRQYQYHPPETLTLNPSLPAFVPLGFQGGGPFLKLTLPSAHLHRRWMDVYRDYYYYYYYYYYYM